MPTYTVTVANLSLSPQHKSQIAEAITAAHNAQTRAPRFFAQVLFSAANEGDHFVGGRVNTAPQVYVHGLVREGRNVEIKQALMSQMLQEIAQIVDITAEDVWIYLQDIPATQMIEFGRFLPAPGEEAEWEKGMSPGKRATLSNQPHY
ncbi:Phenylpyruvate tautomerase PptA, 4-oxalocrotonate tautomerase family [Marinobacter gudaonensis]|uniref:Phenylpyruvate tautomerase PptA, 4-oxalocrotonate tautomerase family n=1 Tax=Marinobacter gudaonensis TaxID=375760 RepID=A0A1I6GQA1_9GAMM|nr:tautomerase family protein [Marinobacter gudaonensis]SFR44316.1 Phenylpyruvate tautomerase PptA, 4-oxalocrotonate tautomerase family [Marinobacter gudaonensis]